MCGRLAGMSPLIAASRINGVESLTPPPIGDMEIPQARAAWPHSLLIGGLDPSRLAMLPAAAVGTYVRDTLPPPATFADLSFLRATPRRTERRSRTSGP